jgi:hypothetical protein
MIHSLIVASPILLYLALTYWPSADPRKPRERDPDILDDF